MMSKRHSILIDMDTDIHSLDSETGEECGCIICSYKSKPESRSKKINYRKPMKFRNEN